MSTAAVFLSYASQDADAARRICEALRAADVEVWFDQSELVGGDAWDAKIRGQIRECALFVPVISASTQARREGYFRLEWRVAVERMRHMDDDLPFLLPVVIDDTKDSEAFVPERFRDVQWTRLAGGETLVAFCERVKCLLRGEVSPALERQAAGSVPSSAARRVVPSSRRWLILGLAAAAVALALVIARPWRHGTNATPTVTTQRAGSPEVQALIAQMWQIYDKANDSLREDWTLAEEMGARAVKLENDNPEAWAVYSLVTVTAWWSGYDYTDAHFASGISRAERAISLARDSHAARLAYANCLRLRPATRDEGERILRELAAQAPTDPRILRVLASTLRMQKKFDEALSLLDRVFALPGGDVAALFGKFSVLQEMGREREADAVVDQILTIRPSPYAYFTKAYKSTFQHEDLEQARIALEKIPPAFLAKEDGALLASRIWLWRRDYDRCIAALAGVVLEDLMNRYTLNRELGAELRQFLTGQAHQLAGRKTAAEIEWRAGLQKIEQRLASDPGQTVALFWKTRLLASLGQRAEAERACEAFRQLAVPDVETKFSTALLLTTLGRGTEAIPLLSELLRDKDVLAMARTYWLAMLRHDPTFDPLRSDATFKELLESATLRDRSPVTPRAADGTDTKSVAVLAFKNLSGDPTREFFSDGLSEAVTDVLGRVPSLKVVGSASAFSFKGKSVPIPEIARQLGVTHLVEGTVLQEGDTVRITAKLIKADGFQVWVSDKLDRELKNIFALHDEVAGLVANNLSLQLGVRPSAQREVNSEAYELYLRGRRQWNLRSEQGNTDAIATFSRAIELDPKFALAYVGRADARGFLAVRRGQVGTWAQRESPLLTEIAADVKRAQDLEPNLAEAHASLGNLAVLRGNYEMARQEFVRAIELKPNYATAHQWLSLAGWRSGRLEEARASALRAVEADPLSSVVSAACAIVLYNAGDPAALAHAERAVALQPDSPRALGAKTSALLASGQREAAVAVARSLVGRDVTSQGLGRALFTLGVAGVAEEVEAARHVSGPFAAIVKLQGAAALGKWDEFFAGWSGETLQMDDAWFLYVEALDPVRDNPRFMAVLRDAGLLETHARIQAGRAARAKERE